MDGVTLAKTSREETILHPDCLSLQVILNIFPKDMEVAAFHWPLKLCS